MLENLTLSLSDSSTVTVSNILTNSQTNTPIPFLDGDDGSYGETLIITSIILGSIWCASVLISILCGCLQGGIYGHEQRTNYPHIYPRFNSMYKAIGLGAAACGL